MERFNQTTIMKNTSSLFLTLVSYLVVLGAILFLLFMAIPLPLKAQTNPEMVATNTAATNVAGAVVTENRKNAPAPSTNVDGTGAHIGGAGSGDNKVPLIATLSATLALLIPIVGIVMGCSVPMVIVGLLLYFRHRKNKMLHETVRAMVEKGVPIPPEMFKTGTECTDSGRAGRPRNDLRKGLILLCVGIGVVILAGKAGYIVLFLGVAFVVASFFEKKGDNQNQPPKP
jgi:hypothetical protein